MGSASKLKNPCYTGDFLQGKGEDEWRGVNIYWALKEE